MSKVKPACEEPRQIKTARQGVLRAVPGITGAALHGNHPENQGSVQQRIRLAVPHSFALVR